MNNKEAIKIAKNLSKDKFNIIEEDIIGVYLFGSRIYGTNNDKSDYDFILITNKDINNEEIKDSISNVHIYNKDVFQEMLNQHKIVPMEIFFSNEKEMEEKGFYFELNLQKLRLNQPPRKRGGFS